MRAQLQNIVIPKCDKFKQWENCKGKIISLVVSYKEGEKLILIGSVNAKFQNLIASIYTCRWIMLLTVL